ncbi:signal peptidase II [Geobacillus stearothermophilus]|nr:signal peptidase II [Geobacillus stearothermophilus]
MVLQDFDINNRGVNSSIWGGLLLYLVALLAILIDQFIKFMVKTYMQVGDSIILAGDFLHFTSHRNTGTAWWGMLAGRCWLLVSLALVTVYGCMPAILLINGHVMP